MADERRERIDLSRVPVRSLLEFDACTRCGECSITCPTGGEAEEKEERTPRGKIRKLRKIRRIERNPILRRLAGEDRLRRMRQEFSRSIYECSVCGMCSEVCPVSLDTISMWENLRWALTASELGPMPSHESLVKSIENYDNPWMQPRSQRARWAKRQAGIADASREQVNVLYYVGCTASYDPEMIRVAKNLADILDTAGMRLGILGKEEKCCGSTLLRIGEVETAMKLAEQNVEIFRRSGADRIVTACAGCFKTISQDYPRLTGEEVPITHVTQLLAELLKDRKIPFSETPEEIAITYHDPCHLGRHTGMYEWPREIIENLPGVRLIEMERTRERARCCGAGGGLKTIDLELALRISEMRICDAEATGASVLVTSCPFCLQTLAEAARRRRSKIRVADITDLVRERMRT